MTHLGSAGEIITRGCLITDRLHGGVTGAAEEQNDGLGDRWSGDDWRGTVA